MICGTYAILTREDATPRWLGKFLNEHFSPESRWEAVEIVPGMDGVALQRSRIVGSPAAYKVPVLCAACNNEWASSLEVEVRPILCPMILGEVTHLNPEALTTLATWATKTALIYEFVQATKEGTTTSFEDRKWFWHHRQPLPDSQIWLARYTGTRGAHIVCRKTLALFDREDPRPIPIPHGLFTVLVFGQLALRVVILRSQRVYPTSYELWGGTPTRVVWPLEEDVGWPPAYSLDDAALDAFMTVKMAPNVEPGHPPQ